ncbi:ornithine cyclodeaminase family protein [Maritalea porphyrae]|uniref:ornithine cyclodeaminase family protein n=1 Tax=Maritalea porphyrae TaxID=880732 RepID=UPI0022AF6BCD|nr:ornithine cyclodeaminase family protein [Maritalea porphyrae]MCZ4273126.1 ornithine cyclodeaminase family protein [Maritalea porphyrae]
MRILNREEIVSLSDFNSMAEAIERSYIAVSNGGATIPPVGYLPLAQHNGDCHVKFGHLHGDSVFIVKIATGFYGNAKLGLPTSNGMMVALSAQTGEVVAILQDEGFLTDLRTAIGAAIATRKLAKPSAKNVLVVGAGIQATQQILALKNLMPERTFNFKVWARSAEKLAKFVEEMNAADCKLSQCTNLELGCGEAEIIMTTTPSRTPIIMDEWVQTGTHITASGADAPGKSELDISLIKRAHILVADKIDQCLDHGEFANANAAGLISQNDCVELGNVLANKKLGRQTNDQITIADLTGLASQDIAAARTVLEADGVV